MMFGRKLFVMSLLWRVLSFCTDFIFNLHKIYFHFAQKRTLVFGLELIGFKQKGAFQIITFDIYQKRNTQLLVAIGLKSLNLILLKIVIF